MSTTVGETGETAHPLRRGQPSQRGTSYPRGRGVGDGGSRGRGNHRGGTGIGPSNRGRPNGQQGGGSFRFNNGNNVGNEGFPRSPPPQQYHRLGGDQHSNQLGNPTALPSQWPQQHQAESASTRRDSAIDGVNPSTNSDCWKNGGDKISRQGNGLRQNKDLVAPAAYTQISSIPERSENHHIGRQTVAHSNPTENIKPMAKSSTTEDSESVAGSFAGVQLGGRDGHYDRIDPQIHVDSGIPLRTPASILEEWAAATSSSTPSSHVAQSHNSAGEKSNGHHSVKSLGASPPLSARPPASISSSNRVPAIAPSRRSSVMSSGSEQVNQRLGQDRQTMNLRGGMRNNMAARGGRYVAKPSDIRGSSKRAERTKADIDEISRRMFKEWLDLDQFEESGTEDEQTPSDSKNFAPPGSITFPGQGASVPEVRKHFANVSNVEGGHPDGADEGSVAATEVQKDALHEGHFTGGQRKANPNESAAHETTSSTPGTCVSVSGEFDGDATSIHCNKEKSGGATPSVKTSADGSSTRLRLTSKNLQQRTHAGVRLEGEPTGGSVPRIDSWRKSVANTQDDNDHDNLEFAKQTGNNEHMGNPARAKRGFATPSRAPSSMAGGGLSQSARSDDGMSDDKPQRVASRGDSFRISSIGSEARAKKPRDRTASAIAPKKEEQNGVLQALVAEAQQRGEKPDFGAILKVLQEQEAKKMGEKENDRKGHPRHVDSANLQKARNGPGTKKGSSVAKEIDRHRNERYHEQLPSPEEIKCRCEIKMAEPMDMDNQVSEGEIYDWSRRRWNLDESDATHFLFRDWLKSISALEESEIHVWDEKFQDGRLHIISHQWYESDNELEDVFSNVDSGGFYAAPWTNDDIPMTVLSLEDELNYEHKHETSAGYIHNWMAEDDRIATEEEQRQEVLREHSRQDAERQEQERRIIEDRKSKRSACNANKTQGEAGEPCSIPNIYIRPIESKDVSHVVAIHNHYIDKQYLHDELRHMTTAEIKDQLKECADEKLPFLIAAMTTHGTGHAMNNAFENVLGFACIKDYKSPQSVFKFAGRINLFVAPNAQNQGVGTCLLERLLMIFDDKYVPKNICHFDCAPSERSIYLSGKVRPLRKLIFSINYPSKKECEYKKWVRNWLIERYGFEKQGCLRGVGIKKQVELDCDILVRGVTPFNASKKKSRLTDLN